MPDIQNISLRHLVLSPLNVRKTRTKENIEQMAASILSQGLLQNLRVHTQEEGSYGVVIGGTRLAALQLLLKQKKITEDYQVPCDVRPSEGRPPHLSSHDRAREPGNGRICPQRQDRHEG